MLNKGHFSNNTKQVCQQEKQYMSIIIRPSKEHRKPKFAPLPIEGVNMAKDDSRQCSFWLDKEMDKGLDKAVSDRKDEDRTYSRSRVLHDAWKIYSLVLRFHASSKSSQSVYEFALDALQSFIDRKKQPK